MVSTSCLHYSRESPGIRVWVGPRTALDGCEKSRPLQGFDHRTVQLLYRLNYPDPPYEDLRASYCCWRYGFSIKSLPHSIQNFHMFDSSTYLNDTHKRHCCVFITTIDENVHRHVTLWAHYRICLSISVASIICQFPESNTACNAETSGGAVIQQLRVQAVRPYWPEVTRVLTNGHIILLKSSGGRALWLSSQPITPWPLV